MEKRKKAPWMQSFKLGISIAYARIADVHITYARSGRLFRGVYLAKQLPALQRPTAQ